jgi:hypothetical protein
MLKWEEYILQTFSAWLIVEHFNFTPNHVDIILSYVNDNYQRKVSLLKSYKFFGILINNTFLC